MQNEAKIQCSEACNFGVGSSRLVSNSSRMPSSILKPLFAEDEVEVESFEHKADGHELMPITRSLNSLSQPHNKSKF